MHSGLPTELPGDYYLSNVFRVSRLQYPDIANLQSAVGQLSSQNQAIVELPRSIQELVATFTMPELLKLLWIGYAIELPVNWRVMLNRVLSDPCENMARCPDLICFRCNDLHYGFIELNGPGDSLQKNQLRWKQRFSEYRIPGCVVKVWWADIMTAPVTL